MAHHLPALFFGHGNPMNALQRNVYTKAWNAIGKSLARPKAILAISAHWFVPQTGVTVTTAPRTIHDFGGFPRELYQVKYPAPGDPDLARRVQKLLAPLPVQLDESWGLDHGAWSVLCHVYPQADIPIVQLSIDETQPPAFHYELGRRLAPLRGDGVLIIGSGNLVHNLHAYAWGRHPVDPFDWAVRFETQVREMLLAGEHKPLIDYEKLGRDAMLSIPTPDHYLPLLYTVSTRQQGEPIAFPVEGVDGGSISMLTVQGWLREMGKELFPDFVSVIADSGHGHVSCTHLRIHPAIHQLLQACLAAEMLGLCVVGQHVFPGIYLEHLALNRFSMRPEAFRPRQPPVIDITFLLTADIAVEGFSPGHRTSHDRVRKSNAIRILNANPSRTKFKKEENSWTQGATPSSFWYVSGI